MPTALASAPEITGEAEAVASYLAAAARSPFHQRAALKQFEILFFHCSPNAS